MKIEVNIEKRYFFVIIGAILLLGGVIFVYAYGGNNPSVIGHSLGEIDGFPNCIAGQALTHNSTGWGCTNVNAGTTINNILNTDYCNSVGVYHVSGQPAATGQISLIKDCRNICADISGCTISTWLNTDSGNAFGIKFRQNSDNTWDARRYDNNVESGINGNSVEEEIDDLANLVIYDDLTGIENNANSISFRTAAGIGMIFGNVTVCDY